MIITCNGAKEPTVLGPCSEFKDRCFLRFTYQPHDMSAHVVDLAQ